LSRLPPEILVPGHSPNHAQKCFSVGHFFISVPISEISFKAVLTSIPGTVVRSDPMSCFKWLATSNLYSFFFALPAFLNPVVSLIGERIASFFLSRHHIPLFFFGKNHKLQLLVLMQTSALVDNCPEGIF
jgi:hypothetical protein